MQYASAVPGNRLGYCASVLRDVAYGDYPNAVGFGEVASLLLAICERLVGTPRREFPDRVPLAITSRRAAWFPGKTMAY